jgi:hypothetical protein
MKGELVCFHVSCHEYVSSGCKLVRVLDLIYKWEWSTSRSARFIPEGGATVTVGPTVVTGYLIYCCVTLLGCQVTSPQLLRHCSVAR